VELRDPLLEPGAFDLQRQVADAQIEQPLFGQRVEIDAGFGTSALPPFPLA